MADDEDEQALARREGSALADPYEREYMAGEGTVVYRDRMVAGKKFNGFLLATAAFCIGYPLLIGAPWFATATVLPMLALMWVLFGVLRTTVSSGAVNIQYGLFGPKIPLAAIESATVIDYDWKQFGGWGIRRGREGWMYNMMGDGGRAVKIVWRDKNGKRKTTFVGTRTADRLGEAISRARAALPAAADRAAIEAGDEPGPGA